MHPLASFDLGSSPRGARRNQRGHQEKWPVFWDRFILGIIISLPGHVVINGPPDEGDLGFMDGARNDAESAVMCEYFRHAIGGVCLR